MVSAIERQMLQSQVIDRIQQLQQRHPEMQQHYFESQLAQERRKLGKKVNESDSIRHATVDDDEGNKQQKEHPRDQESAEQAVEGNSSCQVKQNDHIDIQV